MSPPRSLSNTGSTATTLALAFSLMVLAACPLVGEPSKPFARIDQVAREASRSTMDTSQVPKPAHHLVADLNLELIQVEAGTFTMGSPAEEPLRHKAEGPQRRVTLTKGYWLGKTEVTQGQYETIMGTNPSTFQAAGRDAPVERVSWLQAMAFCRTLTERERKAGRLPAGYHFTLPTEAQWEYACRAGTTDHYAGEPNAMTWWEGNSGETTHPVGLKQPNAWGFHDMSGNVLEWCLDWYGDYPRSSQVDPSGPERGYYRIARGGSWRTDLRLGRSAARSGGSPGRLDYTLGFRLALVAD
jgi:formylglycine-generating enzyme required for sulfatase activity